MGKCRTQNRTCPSAQCLLLLHSLESRLLYYIIYTSILFVVCALPDVRVNLAAVYRPPTNSFLFIVVVVVLVFLYTWIMHPIECYLIICWQTKDCGVFSFSFRLNTILHLIIDCHCIGRPTPFLRHDADIPRYQIGSHQSSLLGQCVKS